MDPTLLYRLFRQAVRACQLYPADSPVPAEAIARLGSALRTAVPEEGLPLAFLDDGTYLDGRLLPIEADEAGTPLGRKLYELGLGELRFLPGLPDVELTRLLHLVQRATAGLLNPVDEDLSVLLWESDLPHVAYWLYDDSAWIDEEMNRVPDPLLETSPFPYIELARAQEGTEAERSGFISSADQVLLIGAEEWNRLPGAWERNGENSAPHPFEGLPLSDYLDSELQITRGDGGAWPALLTDEERLQILTSFRHEVAEEIPWKYGRILIECLRAELDLEESKRIHAAAEQYLRALIDGNRWILVSRLFQTLRPDDADSKDATRALGELAAIPQRPEVARSAGEFAESVDRESGESDSAGSAWTLGGRSPGAEPPPKSGPYFGRRRADRHALRDAALSIFAAGPLEVLQEGVRLAVTGVWRSPAVRDALEARLASHPPFLRACLRDPHAEVRLFALEHLTQVDAETARLLRDFARAPEPSLRAAALRALAQAQRAAAAPLLAEALQDPTSLVRLCAAECLAEVGGPAALEPLLRTVVARDFDARPRDERVRLLVAAGQAAPQDVFPVLARLAEQKRFLPWRRLGEKASVALEALVHLGDPARAFAAERWQKRRADLWRSLETLRAAEALKQPETAERKAA